MSDIPTMDEEPKGCPSCQAVAATWIGGCDNPIHIHQANAHILHLEQQLATAQAAVMEGTETCEFHLAYRAKLARVRGA